MKYRTGGELAGVLKAVLAAAVKAGGDVFVVTAVVREEWLHGSFVLYRVACGPRAFLVNPAAVVRIDPPAPPAEEEQRADGAAEYQAANPPAALEWHAISSNVGRTADGRFEIQTSARNLHVARDLWTGEQTGGLANRYSAEEWCRARLAAAPLTWVEYGGGWRVSGADHQYQVYADMAGFAGCDRRTGTEAHFDASADALRWCEVRAACRVEPGGVLVYERPDEVPF